MTLAINPQGHVFLNGSEIERVTSISIHNIRGCCPADVEIHVDVDVLRIDFDPYQPKEGTECQRS